MRRQFGATQKDVGKALGISYVHVGRIERGETPLTFEYARALAAIFKLHASELLIGQDAQINYQLHQLIQDLNLEARHQWLRQGLQLLSTEGRVERRRA